MSSEVAPADAAPPILRRHVTAAVIGNWLEFYDFTVFALFAVPIGKAFFPNQSEFMQLMLALITFGAGFVCRPIGAVIIGRFADRVGRRPAMLLSFAMMGVAILGLACVPAYRQIGVAAPILAVACRLIQGFALGGEVGPTTAYLIEAAPIGHRGLYGSWQSASQSIATLSGGVLGFTLGRLMSEHGYLQWGWRIAFLIGALVLPVGFVIRSRLPETRGRPEARLAAHPESPAILAHWRILLLGLGLIAGGTISTYVFIFMNTYAQKTLRLSVTLAFLFTVVNGAAGFLSSLAGGALSDRFGRRPMMIWPRLAFLVAILPVFLVVTHSRNPYVLLSCMAVLSILGNLAGVPALVALTESLRQEIRGVATATVYATAVAVFGGTTQPMVAWLGEVSHNHMAIAYYLMAGTLVALIASVLMVETVMPRTPASQLP